MSPRPVSLFVASEPGSGALWNSLSAAQQPDSCSGDEFVLWRDVFVRQPLPWKRFFQSAILHAGAMAMCWMLSVASLRQQNVLIHPVFDRSSLVTYSPDEYLPPLDTGRSDPAPADKGDPAYAKQPIISVPPEPDNRAQTIVTPPDLRLNQDVPLPNIVAVEAAIPPVPLEATRTLFRTTAPETVIIPPSPELAAVHSKAVRNTLSSGFIAPPPDVARSYAYGVADIDAKIVGPPPDLPRSFKGSAGQISIGPSEVVAPAPQLVLAAQHALAARGLAALAPAGPQPVAPAPSLRGAGGSRSGRLLITLGIHPLIPAGPIVGPKGNRRGTFAATPEGKPGASGMPGSAEAAAGASHGYGKGNNGGNGSRSGTNGSLPSGLHVGAMDSAAVASSGGMVAEKAPARPRVLASVTTPHVSSHSRPASPVSADKVTEVDRKVFRGKRFYSMTLNMPNLNSATGSWVMRFAELKEARKEGDLIGPVATEKSDPGYPIELMRDNVQGTVTLYAVIHADGSVGDIRVLSSPDERLDAFASSALARWKFAPATKNGSPVALEAVVMIPFRVKNRF